MTHDLEPFVPLAHRAVALRQGRASCIEELPADSTERLARLEALARG